MSTDQTMTTPTRPNGTILPGHGQDTQGDSSRGTPDSRGHPETEVAGGAMDRALARGQHRLETWIREGVLLDERAIETAWNVTTEMLDAAHARGEVFSLWILGQRWYPAEVLKFGRYALAEVNRALGDTDPTSKLLFLLREHGATGGLSPSDAVARGRLADVVRAAEAWAEA